MDTVRYIIRFNDYKDQSIHSEHIKSILDPIALNSYSILHRNNAATNQYPTDFIVLQIFDDSISPKIRSLLHSLPSIKDMNIDRVIHRKRELLARERGYDDPIDLNDIDVNHRTGGKLFTEWSFEEEQEQNTNHSVSTRKLQGTFLITDHLEAHKVWDNGYHGEGVNVAVFDTGIDENHSHFNHIDERTNWTNEDQLKDGIGHGSFVAGIIASKFQKCPGFAPEAIINTFRVFTNSQMSYTSWFLDSFNYAIYRKMNILNLSIGGPDWLDIPFVEKVREMQANNVIMITACGNDGKYGTINNPADQLSVIGVGGITQNDKEIAGFQSRGMTTWELPRGYGRIKPDIVTVGQSLYGSSIDGGCRTLSGTSVASPVVTGVAALLTSVVPRDKRWDIMNPASLKQVLVETADSVDGLRMYEQGMGKINVPAAYQYIKDYTPHVSAVPAELHLTECPHAWPFCGQPLYWSSEPYILNITLLNPFSVVGEIKNEPTFKIDDIIFENGRTISRAEIERNGEDYKLIDMEFQYKQRLWPWSGWLGIFIYAAPSTSKMQIKSLSGSISLEINVIGKERANQWVTHSLSIDYSLSIIPTPLRSQRILWDQFHNLQYPMGYFPRDDLERESDMLDWFGDHPQSNYHSLYDFLKEEGYFIEVLRTDYSCIDPSKYGTLIIVDSEDKFDSDEIAKIQHDVLHDELSIIVLADWYNAQLAKEARFFDDNTRSVWDALTGGANIPALNDLLQPFGIQFGDLVVAGDLNIGNGHSSYFQSGNSIMKSPPHSHVLKTNKLRHIESVKKGNKKSKSTVDSIPLVMYDTNHLEEATNGGRIAVFGDSTCADANQLRTDCFWLIDMMIHFTAKNEIHEDLDKVMTVLNDGNIDEVFNEEYLSKMKVPEIREMVSSQFDRLSRVHNMDQLECPEMLTFTPRVRSNDHLEGQDIRNRGHVEYKGAKGEKPMEMIRDLDDGIGEVVDSALNRYQKGSAYKFVVEPHLYGHGKHNRISNLGMFENVMFIYPFVVIITMLIAMWCFCPPIRRLIPCQCGNWRARTRHFTQRTYRRIQGDEYYHV